MTESDINRARGIIAEMGYATTVRTHEQARIGWSEALDEIERLQHEPVAARQAFLESSIMLEMIKLRAENEQLKAHFCEFCGTGADTPTQQHTQDCEITKLRAIVEAAEKICSATIIIPTAAEHARRQLVLALKAWREKDPTAG